MKYLPALTTALVLQFATVLSAQADEPVLLDGETAVVRGQIFIAEGEDLQERKVTYLAIRLNAPVTIADKVERFTNVRVLMLSPSKPVSERFQQYIGKQVQAKGKVLFRWHGPSSLPNPTMLVVQEVKPVRE